MKRIAVPELDEQDIKILENISLDELNKQFDFLRSYKQFLWRNSQFPEPMPLEEIRKKHTNIQSLPEYPEELKAIGLYYHRLGQSNNIKVSLYEEGFFDYGSDASLGMGTLYSPSLIAARIADAYARDCFCDGLLGEGIEEGLYLKFILHLIDCKLYYDKHNKS